MNYINFYKHPLIHKQAKQLPEVLIYQKLKSRVNTIVTDSFIMFKPQNSKIFSTMTCCKDYINRDGKENTPSLYISYLFSHPIRHGLGGKMLDFAKLHSKEVGCKGNFHLDACGGYLPNHIPHIFYRKSGMNTTSALINFKLDKFIKKQKKATYRDFSDVTMYYPPIKINNNWIKIFSIFL